MTRPFTQPGGAKAYLSTYRRFSKESGFAVYKTSPWLYPDPGLTNVNRK